MAGVQEHGAHIYVLFLPLGNCYAPFVPRITRFPEEPVRGIRSEQLLRFPRRTSPACGGWYLPPERNPLAPERLAIRKCSGSRLYRSYRLRGTSTSLTQLYWNLQNQTK